MPFHTPAERGRQARKGQPARFGFGFRFPLFGFFGRRPTRGEAFRRPIRFGGIIKQGKQVFVRQPPVFAIRPVPQRPTGLTKRPTRKPTALPILAITRRSQRLSTPQTVQTTGAAPAVIGERRAQTQTEIAAMRKAAPRAVDPNLVRLANRQTPRVPPTRKRLLGGGSFGGIRARGVGFTG